MSQKDLKIALPIIAAVLLIAIIAAVTIYLKKRQSRKPQSISGEDPTKTNIKKKNPEIKPEGKFSCISDENLDKLIKLLREIRGDKDCTLDVQEHPTTNESTMSIFIKWNINSKPSSYQTQIQNYATQIQNLLSQNERKPYTHNDIITYFTSLTCDSKEERDALIDYINNELNKEVRGKVGDKVGDEINFNNASLNKNDKTIK